MSFIRLWLTGYGNPVQLVDQLRLKPAPHWGLLAQLIRGLLDSLLLYLPVALMGRIPPTPSYLSFVPTERYYHALIGLSPVVFIAQLMLIAAFIHVAIRLIGRRSDFDQIVNICGMAGLVVGAFLVPWDWAWFLVGGVDQYLLGISHLVLDLYAVLIIALGLRRSLGVPVRLATVLSLLTIPVALPFGIMFMRSPF